MCGSHQQVAHQLVLLVASTLNFLGNLQEMVVDNIVVEGIEKESQKDSEKSTDLEGKGMDKLAMNRMQGAVVALGVLVIGLLEDFVCLVCLRNRICCLCSWPLHTWYQEFLADIQDCEVGSFVLGWDHTHALL